jgi:hypothetical protein
MSLEFFVGIILPEVLIRVKEQRNIVQEISKWKAEAVRSRFEPGTDFLEMKGVYLKRIKRPGRDADPSPHSSA